MLSMSGQGTGVSFGHTNDFTGERVDEVLCSGRPCSCLYSEEGYASTWDLFEGSLFV